MLGLHNCHSIFHHFDSIQQEHHHLKWLGTHVEPLQTHDYNQSIGHFRLAVGYNYQNDIFEGQLNYRNHCWGFVS